MVGVRYSDTDVATASCPICGDATRARARVRAEALAECLAIARAAVEEFGPLTAAGIRSVADRIQRLMEA
jgi:hypothetical protein